MAMCWRLPDDGPFAAKRDTPLLFTDRDAKLERYRSNVGQRGRSHPVGVGPVDDAILGRPGRAGYESTRKI